MAFTLAPIFNNNMVFQAEKTIRVFGTTKDSIELHINILNKDYHFNLDAGSFVVELDKIEVTRKPFDVLIQSQDQNVILENCLAGDVYLCTGQSNMQYVCKDVKDIIYTDIPNLRLYEVPKLPYVGAEKEFDWLYKSNPKWDIATHETEKEFSAIGYMIGKDISIKHDIPVGIVSCNMGDTTIYSWLDEKVIKRNKILRPYYDKYLDWKKEFKTYKAFAEYYNKQVPKLMEFWGLLDEYRAKGYSSEDVYKLAYEKIPCPYLPMGPKNQNRPSGCYETMLKTIIPFANNGIVYYQGENDVSRATEYTEAIDVLIKSWRDAFCDEVIFINCQIAGHIYSDTKGLEVARLRDAQSSISNPLKRQFVTTAIDYGEESNIHPVHKTVVAKRIFNVLDQYIYQTNEFSLSPMLESYTIELGKIYIHTKNNKLNLRMKETNTPSFFGLTQEDKLLPINEVSIVGNTLIIDDIRTYKEIRYAYDAFPELSIYTENDLPLLPFRIIL